ncbi:MAG: hypothetical protein ACRDP7_42710 [Trebonia sp.]
MNDNDELNDSAVLSAVRDSISEVPLPTAPGLEAITARGRARRRRHLGALTVASTGACAALAAGLVATSGSAGPAPQHDAPPVQLAAFSVVAGPGGTTTLTLYPGQVADPSAVRQALAAHGIPALVTAGEFCSTANHQLASGTSRVVTMPAPDKQQFPASGNGPVGFTGFGPFVIHGSAIPSGAELSIGYRQDPQHREISLTLVPAGATLTCTSIVG